MSRGYVLQQLVQQMRVAIRTTAFTHHGYVSGMGGHTGYTAALDMQRFRHFKHVHMQLLHIEAVKAGASHTTALDMRRNLHSTKGRISAYAAGMTGCWMPHEPSADINTVSASEVAAAVGAGEPATTSNAPAAAAAAAASASPARAAATGTASSGASASIPSIALNNAGELPRTTHITSGESYTTMGVALCLPGTNAVRKAVPALVAPYIYRPMGDGIHSGRALALPGVPVTVRSVSALRAMVWQTAYEMANGAQTASGFDLKQFPAKLARQNITQRSKKVQSSPVRRCPDEPITCG